VVPGVLWWGVALQDWVAKLTDFGLAKGADTDQTHVTTRIMGTMGYLDPKYMETGTPPGAPPAAWRQRTWRQVLITSGATLAPSAHTIPGGRYC